MTSAFSHTHSHKMSPAQLWSLHSFLFSSFHPHLRQNTWHDMAACVGVSFTPFLLHFTGKITLSFLKLKKMLVRKHKLNKRLFLKKTCYSLYAWQFNQYWVHEELTSKPEQQHCNKWCNQKMGPRADSVVILYLLNYWGKYFITDVIDAKG